MSIAKYTGWHDGSNTPLFWMPGTGLPPLRGTNGGFGLTEDMLQRVYIAKDFDCRLFQLWVPEDAKAYKAVKDAIANGLAEEKFIDRQFVPEHGHYAIFLEWHQLYSQIEGRIDARADEPRPRSLLVATQRSG